MLSSLLMAAFVAQASEEGFSKLQIFMQQLIDWGVGAGGRIIGAVIIFVVGRFLISFIKKLVSKLLMKRHIDAGIQSFVKSLVNILLTILLIIAVIGKLGVETTSFAALLASAGVAVGMALSGNLQNFAGGLIVILAIFHSNNPVYATGILTTVISHSTATQSTVRNINHLIISRSKNSMEYLNLAHRTGHTLAFNPITYLKRAKQQDDKVESTVRRILAADSRILNAPAPFVALHALDASSVNIVIRVWVKSSDYWGVYFDMNKTIYTVFNEEGIGFPFPQLTVHQAKD